MARFLQPDAIQYGVIRCFAHGGAGASAIRQAKFIFFIWKGPTAGLKAKMAAQNARAPIQAFFDGCVEMEISGPEELTEESIASKLTAKGGG